MVRIDITERFAAQRTVNNPALRGKPLHVRAGLPGPSFRLIIGSKVQAGTGDALRRNLDRAIRTGVFKSEFFTQRQAVRTGARVLPGVQRLAPATIRALEKQRVIVPRFETRAGIAVKPRPETFAQRSARLARERRVNIGFGVSVPSPGKVRARELEKVRKFFREKGGPLAVGVTSQQLREPFLEALNILLTPQTFTTNTLDAIGKRLDLEGRRLDKKIFAGTANQAQVNKFNVLVNQFNAKVGKDEARQFREFFRDRPSPLKPQEITASQLQEFIGDIKVEDVVPTFLGGKGVDFVKSGKEFAKTLVDLSKTVTGKAPANLRQLEKTNTGIINAIGNVLGVAFAGFETLRRGTVLGIQEGVKLSGNLGILRKGGVKIFVPDRVLQGLKEAQKIDTIVFTNPLKFIRVSDDGFVFTPRATGEIATTFFELIVVLEKGVFSINKVKAGGKVGQKIANIRITNVRPNISSFANVKVTKLGRLSKLVRAVPEIRAIKIRVGLEVGAFVGRNRTRFLVLQQKAKIKLKPIDEILTSAKDISNAQVKKAVGGVKTVVQDLKNIRTLAVSSRTKKAISLEIRRLTDGIKSITPTFRKRGRFLDFTRFQRFRRVVGDSFKRIGVEVKSLKPSIQVTAKRVKREARLVARDSIRSIQRAYRLEIKKINSSFSILSLPVRSRVRKVFKSVNNVLQDKSLRIRNLLKKTGAKLDTQVIGSIQELEQFLKIQSKRFTDSVKKAGRVVVKKVSDKPSVQDLTFFLKNIKASANGGVKALRRLRKNVSVKIKKDLQVFTDKKSIEIKNFRVGLVKKIRGDLKTPREKRRLIQEIERDARRMDELVKKSRLEAFRKKVNLQKRIGRRLQKVERRKLDSFFKTKKFTQRRAGARLNRRLKKKEKKLSKRIETEKGKLQRIIKKGVVERRLEKRLDKVARRKKGEKKFIKRRAEARLRRRKIVKEQKKQLREFKSSTTELRTARKLEKIQRRKLGLKKFQFRRNLARRNRRIRRKNEKLENRQLRERAIGLSELRLARRLKKVERRKLGVKKFIERRKQARLRRRANAKQARRELRELLSQKRDNQALRLQRKIRNFEAKKIGTPSQEEALRKQLSKQVKIEKQVARLAVEREKIRTGIKLFGKAPRGKRSNAQLLRQFIERDKAISRTIARKPFFREFKPKLGKGERLVKTKTGQVQVVRTDTKQVLKTRTRQVRKQRLKVKQIQRVRVKQVTRSRQQLKLKQKQNARQILLLRGKIRQDVFDLASGKTRLRSNVKARTQLRQGLKPITIPKARATEVTRFRTRQRVRAATRAAIILKPKTILKPRVAPRVAIRPRVARRIVLRQRITPITTLRRVPRVPPFPPVLIPIPGPKVVSFSSIARSKGPFNVIVRQRGKKVKLNRFPLTGSQALAFGGFKVDNAAIRSFFIVKTTGRTRAIKVPRFTPRKFRRPIGNTKLERFFLVERSRFLIDTKGEKREITRKGLAALRRRRLIRKRKRKTKRRVTKRTRRRVRRRKVKRKRRVKRRRK